MLFPIHGDCCAHYSALDLLVITYKLKIYLENTSRYHNITHLNSFYPCQGSRCAGVPLSYMTLPSLVCIVCNNLRKALITFMLTYSKRNSQVAIGASRNHLLIHDLLSKNLM